tara:strand:- start:296 stop:430 length:135 start_codon:yes stop_codon:yes gene_type:complete
MTGAVIVIITNRSIAGVIVITPNHSVTGTITTIRWVRTAREQQH